MVSRTARTPSANACATTGERRDASLVSAAQPAPRNAYGI
jgi:hypothetical protein